MKDPNPANWKRVLELVEEALAMPDGERADWLERECRTDSGLLGQAHSLLRTLLHPSVGTRTPRPATVIHDLSVARSSEALELDLGAERVIGNFELEREIGRGGMGVVWRARDRVLDRPVALKLLPHGAALVPQALQRFKLEARAGGRLSHPGVVAIYAFGEHEGAYYIAQRLVGSGRTLADLIADRRHALELPANHEPEVASLFVALAEALQCAHDAGVIHRDVKPSNILLDDDGTPMVGDFGLAKVEGSLSISHTGDLTGTPYYMSPEQAASQRIGIDHRTDIFSLGAALYEALTFTRAFEGTTMPEVLERILLDHPEPPDRVRPGVSAELARVCMRALSKRRDDRQASMGELADELREAAGLEPAVSPAAPTELAVQSVDRARPPAAPAEPPGLSQELLRYLRAVEAAYDHVTLAGFETRLRVPIQLEDLYVPLDAMVDTRAVGGATFGSADEAEDRLRDLDVDCARMPLTEAFARAEALGGRRGLVILGDPGSGKTTHLKRLLLWLVREGPESLGLPTGMVPIFLPLRNLRDLGTGLDAFIEAELATPHLRLPPGFGRRLLDRGNLLFLLDGLDEVADPGQRGEVARWIEGAMVAHPDSTFVVTCRYAGYAREAQIDGRLLELHLRPLSAEQARDFIRSWYRIVESSLVADKERSLVLAESSAEELIRRLEQPDFRSSRVLSLTRNPLLLTAICLVHRDRGNLPKRRGKLYDECINVLLERWRDAKNLAVAMDAQAARRVLQPVAYWLHSVEGRTRASAAELGPVIEPPLARLRGYDGAAGDFLRHVRDESGLLTGWSGDRFGFMHLGFQEYLTALEVKDSILDEPEKFEHLATKFGLSWWREVTLLLLALEGPRIFERFMRRAVDHPGFATDAALIEECIDDSLDASMTPFVELLEREPGTDEELWERQLVAVRILQRHAPETLEPLVECLREHPHRPLADRFAPVDQAEVSYPAERGGYQLVRVPAGTYELGAPATEEGHVPTDSPPRTVTVEEFLIGRHPVTNEEYGRYLADNPDAPVPEYWGSRQYDRPNQPVVGISWSQAQAYCDWAGLRLPSEDEWEVAARAGSTTRFWLGDGGDHVERSGWHSGNSGRRLHPVGELIPNPFGLYDVHGNVWEWSADLWSDDEATLLDHTARLDLRSIGDIARTVFQFRTLRGGSFREPAARARSAARTSASPDERRIDIGFRAAR